MLPRTWRRIAGRVFCNMVLFGFAGPVLGAMAVSLALLGWFLFSAGQVSHVWQAIQAAVLVPIVGIVTGIAFLLGGPPALATAIAMGLLQHRITARRHCLWIGLIGVVAGALYEWCLFGGLRLVTLCSGPAALGCALISRKAYMGVRERGES